MDSIANVKADSHCWQELIPRAKSLAARSDSSSWELADVYLEMKERGGTVREIAAECGTNHTSVVRFIQCVVLYRTKNERPAFWEAYKEATEPKETAQLIVASNENEWYTPEPYVEAARDVLGAIDLDPASCRTANKTVKAAKFFSQADDGLLQEWHGRVWLNPPYGRLAGDFVLKLVQEYKDGKVDEAVLLVNAHCTDTEWFEPLWDHLLCFTNHRIDFDSSKDKDTTSTHGSVFVYFGKKEDAFVRAFSEFGTVVKKI